MINGFGKFWMGSLHQEYPVNARVSQGSILGTVLHLYYYTLMNFLMMISVILLLILMILQSTLLFLLLWLGIWSVTTKIGFFTWIWSKRQCGMEQKAIMPTHLHQVGVTRILKSSSPACQDSYLFTCISTVPNISMSNEWWTLFSLQVKLKYRKLPSETAVTLTQ